jgi:hypothetical protein
MLRKLASRSALVVAALAAVVAACNFSGDFTIRRTFLGIDRTNGTWTSPVEHVDLASEAPGAWKRRGDLKSLDLASVTATATRIGAGGVAMDGTIVLTRGTNVVTGNWSHDLAATAPDSITITLPAEADALLMDAIRGDGKFDVQATAHSAGHINLDLDVVLTIGINYHVGP